MNGFASISPVTIPSKIETARIFLDAPGQPFPATRASPVKTNSVEFDILPMTEAEEAQEIARLKAEARLSTRDPHLPVTETPQRRLTYLTGDAAARDAVSTGLRAGSFAGFLQFRNRELVLQLLEAGYLQPDSSVSQGMIQTMVALRDPKDQAESSRFLLDYLARLSASLSTKNERPRILTAQSIIFALEKNSHPEIAAAAFAVIREHLEAANCEPLLRVRWSELKDPSLIPALERILSNPRLQARGSGPQRAVALNALFDLAPGHCRPFVLAELKNPEGLRDPVLLGRIPDEELPEFDPVLLSRISPLAPIAQRGDESKLNERAKLLARFASPAILPDIQKLYDENSSKWGVSVRADFLAYLLRRKGDQVLPTVRAASDRAGREQGSDQQLLDEMAVCYFSEPLAKLLRERLDSEESRSAGGAAYILSKFGTLDDKSLIQQRLNRTPSSDQWLTHDLTESLTRLSARFP
jgi:hypothetical protein